MYGFRKERVLREVGWLAMLTLMVLLISASPSTCVSIKDDTTNFYKFLLPEVDSLIDKQLFKESIAKERTYFNQQDTNTFTDALVYESLGERYFLLGNKDSSIFYLEKAYAKNLRNLGDTNRAVVIQNNIGVVLYVNDKVGQALPVFIKNLDLGKARRDTQLIVMSYTNIISLYGTTGQWDQCKGYIDSLLVIRNKVDSINLSKVFYVLSMYYNGKSNFEKTRLCMYKAKALFPKKVKAVNDYSVDLKSGLLLIYLSSNNLDSAKFLVKDIINSLKQRSWRRNDVNVLLRLGEYYVKVDSNAKAQEYLGYVKSGIGTSIYRDYLFYYGVYRMYTLLGQDVLARQYLDSAYNAKMLVSNELSGVEIYNIKKDLENEKKAKQFEIAKAKLANKELELLRQKNRLYLFIGLILLFLVILLWFYRSRKERIRIQKELESTLIVNENALAKKEKDLNVARQELNRLIYGATHDMRSPITNLMGLNNLFAERVSDAYLMKMLNMQQTSINRIDHILKSLVDFNVITHKKIECEKFKLNTFVKGLKDTIPELRNQWKDVKVRIDENYVLNTDRFLLNIVLSNLLLNALASVQQNEEEKIVNIYCEPSDNEPTKLKILISDNGKGIPEKIKPKIFKMFVKGDSGSQNSGLGLYVVKKAIDKMNGEISFNSDIKKGTIFKVVLPLYCERNKSQ